MMGPYFWERLERKDRSSMVDLGSKWRCPMMGREGGPGGNSFFFVVLEEKRRVKRVEKHAERDRRMMSQKSMDLAR
jgi:hypothetical protein